MKIKGAKKIIQQLIDMQNAISGQIDEIDWDKRNADELDERLNQAWNATEEAITAIKSIEEI